MSEFDEPLQRRVAGRLNALGDLFGLTESVGIQRFVTHYQDILAKSGGGIPSRSLFMPEALGRHVADAAVFGFGEDGEPVFRLVGETIRARFDTSPIGRPYRDFVPSARADSAVASFTRCRDHRCGMFMRLRKLHANSLVVELDVVGLPFTAREGGEAVTYLIFMDHEREVVKAMDGIAPSGGVTQIISRDFVDLGFGVPADHVDLIPAQDCAPKSGLPS